MFTHPQHIIEIHKRQIHEWTCDQGHDRGSHAATAPGPRPTNGVTLFGRIGALVRAAATPRPSRHTPAPQAE